MAYTNSSMVSYSRLSPNHSGQRTHSIDRITPHCVVGQLSAESICRCFTSPSRQASCNYGIGTDGRVSLCVEEKNRSWCSSSNANDQRAVTIECASDKTEPYAMNSRVYDSLVKLCTDICRRNGSCCGSVTGIKLSTMRQNLMRWFLPSTAGLQINPAPVTGCMQGLAIWRQGLRRHLAQEFLRIKPHPSFTVYARPGQTASRRKVRSASLRMRRNVPAPTKAILYLMKMAKRYILLMHQVQRNPLTPSPVKLSVVIGATVMSVRRNSLPQDMIIPLCRKK